MKNTNSLNAYLDPSNQKKFNTQKAKIVQVLKDNPNHSRFYLGLKLGINDHGIQKRLSDLVNEGTVTVTGERKHGDNTISLYSLSDQLQLFSIPQKQTINAFLKEHYPHILIEFNGRNNHKI